MRAGWQLAGVSWRVLRQERWIPLAVVASAVVSCSIAFVSFVVSFGRLPSADDLTFPRYLLVVPFVWLANLVANLLTCTIAFAVDARMRGEPVTFGDAWDRTMAKFGTIVGWTLLTGTVGLLLYVLAERIKIGGWIAQKVVGLAWSLATMLVIPVLVLEDVTPGRAVRRSASLFRRIWAQSVTADVTIGAAMMLALLPLVMVTALAAVVSVPLAVVVGALGLVAYVGVSGALDTVVRVATYRYAVDGPAAAGIAEALVLSRYKAAD
jgi:hypothetical protein